MIKFDFPDYQRLVSIIRQGELMKEENFKTPYPGTDFYENSKSCNSNHQSVSERKTSGSEKAIELVSTRASDSQLDKEKAIKDMATTTIPYQTPVQDSSQNKSYGSVNAKSNEENM